jgi:hypothetical protein
LYRDPRISYRETERLEGRLDTQRDGKAGRVTARRVTLRGNWNRVGWPRIRPDAGCVTDPRNVRIGRAHVGAMRPDAGAEQWRSSAPERFEANRPLQRSEAVRDDHPTLGTARSQTGKPALERHHLGDAPDLACRHGRARPDTAAAATRHDSIYLDEAKQSAVWV